MRLRNEKLDLTLDHLRLTLQVRHALLEDHQDYLIPDRKWIAACEPIIFDRARDVREDEAISLTEDTGWIVLVQEAATAAAP